MNVWACTVLSLVLLGDADVPVVLHWKPSVQKQVEFPPEQNLPLLPDLGQGQNPPDAKKAGPQPAPKPPDSKSKPLQPESRLAIVRYVSGEFARALKPLPAGRKGFHFLAGQPLDEKVLRQTVANSGPAVNTGDNVQITRIEFREKEIVFDLNGGGRGRGGWRNHIQIDMGGAPMPQATSTTTTNGGEVAPGYHGVGATIFLDFGKPLPDMTPDQLKQWLGVVLDFSKQRSAAVQWVQTLPPEMQQAIKDKHVVVGMTQDMVVAAIGKPEKKVRERDATGAETEDWIYGQPPDKMTFVTFLDEKVVRIREFN